MPLYAPKDVVLHGTDVCVVMAYHPQIADLLIVEGHHGLKYVKENVVSSLH
jgi:hypothetical protein